MMTQEKPDVSAAAGDIRPPIVGDNPSPEVIPELAPGDPAPDLGMLLRKAEDEAAELRDAWLRARADVENIRRQPANTVVQVFQKGYRLNDRVLRPALVAVAKPKEPPDGGDLA